MKILFGRAKSLFAAGTLEAEKQLIDLFVERVDVYRDKIVIKLNILPDGDPPKAHKDKNPCEPFVFKYEVDLR